MENDQLRAEVEGIVGTLVYTDSRKSKHEIINWVKGKNLARKILNMDDETLSKYVTTKYALPEENTLKLVGQTRIYRDLARLGAMH